MTDETFLKVQNSKSVEAVTKLFPVILMSASLLYVGGLYAAYRIDSELNVGTIIVSRERAVSLGFVMFIPFLPIMLMIFTLKDVVQTTESKLQARLKHALHSSIEPLILSLLVYGFISNLIGKPVNSCLILSVTPIVIVALFIVLKHKAEFTKYWLTLNLIMLFLPSVPLSVAKSLPIAYGGHVGPPVVIIMKDKTALSGQMLVSDTNCIVVKIQDQNVAVSRSEVLNISSSAISK